jgi:hypothetical protein
MLQQWVARINESKITYCLSVKKNVIMLHEALSELQCIANLNETQNGYGLLG